MLFYFPVCFLLELLLLLKDTTWQLQIQIQNKYWRRCTLLYLQFTFHNCNIFCIFNTCHAWQPIDFQWSAAFLTENESASFFLYFTKVLLIFLYVKVLRKLLSAPIIHLGFLNKWTTQFVLPRSIYFKKLQKCFCRP